MEDSSVDSAVVGRVLAIASVLPAAAGTDSARIDHEANVLEEMLRGNGWDEASLPAVRERLAEFARCPSSRCRPYIRARLGSMFAGSPDCAGTLNDRVLLLRQTLREYERRMRLSRTPKGRENLLVAAFLLFLEASASGAGRAAA